MKKWRKLLGIFMSGVMLLTGGVLPQDNAAAAEDATDYGISSPRTEGGVTTWDKIKFGSYYQDFEEQPAEPIKWRVLSVDGDDAFLIADKILDTQPYNEKDKSVTWETCTLRTWLNNDFFNEAFDEEEQKAINETTVVNEDNPTYGTEGGEETHDKVYLPSIDEVSNAEYGFDTEFTKKSNTRIAKATGYARVSGVDVSNSYSTAGNGVWWLRSPGYCSYRPSSVSYDGRGEFDGDIVNHSGYGIRPVLHINKSSSKVTYAGKVNSDGDVIVSENMDDSLSNPTVEGEVTTWDCVYFGTYKQELFTEKKDIEWRVLSVDGDDAFLLADKNLDCITDLDFSSGYIIDFYSELSSRLDDFYDEAFDEEEKNAIGEDGVVLLSIEDVCNEKYGFDTEFRKESKTREVRNTDYAKAKGAWSWNSEDDSIAGNGFWLLRPSDIWNNGVSYINGDGRGYEDLPLGYASGGGIRPALHINLSSASWSKAGQVTVGSGDTSAASPEPVDYGLSNPRIENGITTWDKIKFGSYYQDIEEQPAEPIKWRVLSVDEDDAFLLADTVLDAKPYNEQDESVTWETCTLRQWLNEDFYNEAFDEEEKETIYETTVVNENNLSYDTEGGMDTNDKVYLLSIDEAENAAYGFDNESYGSETREAKNTVYAKLNGLNVSNSVDGIGMCDWWLRTLGESSGENNASYISDYGVVRESGKAVNNSSVGVRPALHINLSSSKVTYAGKVDSWGNVTLEDDEISNPTVESGVTTWDCVYFGSYRQNFSKKQDIEWRVLSVDGDDAFLLADRILDYNEKFGEFGYYSDTIWNTWTLRRWLNEEFYNEAFDDEEKEAIKETTVINNEYGNGNTKDKVYQLSIEEASNTKYGFDSEFMESSKLREAKPTDYANRNVTRNDYDNTVGSWWLRSLNDDSYYDRSMSYVDSTGAGNVSFPGKIGVRPVLHINLSSSSWSKVGRINSNGDIIEAKPTPSPQPTEEPSQTDKPAASSKPTEYGISSPRIENNVTTWDKIKFGSYYQDAGTQPIKWRVLSVDGDEAFLLADKILDVGRYRYSEEWLNEDFYNEAFDEEEKEAIVEADWGTYVERLSVSDAYNSDYGFDEVFEEASKTREAKVTDYAKAKGVWSSDDDNTAGNGSWWLSGTDKNTHVKYVAPCVSYFGYGIYNASNVYYSVDGERPALHVNLSSSKVTYAGKVDSEGNVTASGNGIDNPTVEDGVTTWDCVYFGSYRQECIKQDIEWRVLSVDGDDAFLLADRNLDHRYYDESGAESATWETCTLKTWLNEDFYNEAFNDSEKETIKATTVVNDNNPVSSTNGGVDTTDKVYLLSIAEASNVAYGFDAEFAKRSKTREAKNTVYANMNSEEKSGDLENTDKNGIWWLRSPGSDGISASEVYDDGYGSYYGNNVNDSKYGVRPALHIKLSSASWSKAGQIKSNGEVIEETPTPTPSPTPSSEPTDEPSQTDKPSTSAEPTGEPSQTDEPIASAEPTEAPTVYGISSPKVENGVTTWDKIKFGSYYQDGEANTEPIKWRVLSVNGDDAFLIADQILDYKLYDDEYRNVKWEECTLRKWLNEDFYNEAFDSEEKNAVSETTVVTDEDHPYYAEEGGNTTKDKVYLLSIEEAGNKVYGFDTEFLNDSKAREAKNTEYATVNGAASDINGNGSWLLRSHSKRFGFDNFYAIRVSYVGTNGRGSYNDDDMPIGIRGVRPAMHIKLSSSKVKDAGEVDSEGNVTALDNGIHNPTVKDGVTTWDCVYFGNYRQNYTFEKQDIEWRVLSVDGDDAFLLADRILDCKQYNEEESDATWGTSTLRKWLNEDFFDEAFDTNEKQAIIEKTIANKGSSNTKDKVYLLSEAEATTAMYGFDAGSNYTGFYASETRQAKNTLYAKVNGQQSYGTTDNGKWWLRTYAYVDYDGREDSDMYYGKYGVRPALHINLSSSSWSKTGEVSSDEKEDDKPTASPSPAPTGEPSPTDKPTTTAEPTKEPLPTPSPTPIRTPRPSPSPRPTASPEPTGEPSSTDKPTTTAEPTKEPSPTDKPTTTAEPTKEPSPTDKPTTTAEPTGEPSPTDKPTTSAEPTKEPSPTNRPTASAEPTKGPSPTDKPVQTWPPTGGIQPTPPSVETPNPVQTAKPALKKFKLSSVKRTKNTMKITGKVSVKKATVKIKVGKKAYKKAKVKGKKFTLKLKYKLKKKTKIKIQVKKKGYKKLVKTYKVK